MNTGPALKNKLRLYGLCKACQILCFSSMVIFACENTTDKVYLISYQEALNLENKTAKTTDYARALGAWNSKDNSYLHNGAYWTRSPSSVFNYASWNVNSGGHLSEYSVDTVSFSIRPCIRISL